MARFLIKFFKMLTNKKSTVTDDENTALLNSKELETASTSTIQIPVMTEAKYYKTLDIDNEKVNRSIYTKVAGVTRLNDAREPIQNILEEISHSIYEPLILEREEKNRHDKNAIKVYLSSYEHIGYINSNLAADIAPLMDNGIEVKAFLTEITGGDFDDDDRQLSYGCNIQLYIMKTEQELAEDEQFERNKQGVKLEKEGKIDEAIKIYEKNILENFEGNHPYDRLAILYRKQKKYQEEKRVLEHAIKVFENVVSHERKDRMSKLVKFKERLAKCQQLIDKNKTQ